MKVLVFVMVLSFLSFPSLMAQRNNGSTTMPVVLPQSVLRCTQLGDLDNDGHADYAIGDYGAFSTTGQFGKVDVVSSLTHTVLATHWGTALDVGFGFQIGSADFDGNGSRDLLVSTAFGTTARVDVLDPLTGTVLGTMTPASSAYSFGTSLDGRDLDGDGKEEILISALTPTTTSNLFGTIYLFQGGSGLLIKAQTITSFNGFGEQCKFLDDLTGDGQPEIVIATKYALDPNLLYYQGYHGVWDFLNLGAKVHETFGDATFRFLADFAIADDANGDGIRDYVISSVNAVQQCRHHYICGASGALMSLATSPLGEPQNSPPLHRSVADLDGDGLKEIAVLYSPSLVSDPAPSVSILAGSGLALLDRHQLPSSPATTLIDFQVMPDGDGDGFEDMLFAKGTSLSAVPPLLRRSLSPTLAPNAIGNHPLGLELLTVDGSQGAEARRVDLTIGQPFNIAFAADNTVSGPTDFIIFGMLGRPNTSTTYSSSFGNFVVTPRPAAMSNPNLFTLVDSLGYDPMAVLPAAPAPFLLVAPLGLPTATEFTLQGVSVTGALPNVAISNAILIRVQ